MRRTLNSVRPVVNWRRLLVALPLILVAGFAAWWLGARDGADAATPRAVLVDPPGVSESDDVGVRRGQIARDFIAGSADGSTVRLSDLRGAPVVLNFWATWCTSCVRELPELAEVQREYGAENVHVVALNTGESATDADGFLRELGVTDFELGLDPTLTVTDAYGVFGLSTSVFIDADGVVRATYIGQMDKNLMREYIDAAMAGVDGRDPPPKLRLPGTVEARTSTLLVEERSHGVAEMQSRRLRCDDTYCAEGAIDLFARTGGVVSIDSDLGGEPPTITVTFEPEAISLESLAATLAGILESSGDPLYEHPVEVRID